MELSDKVKIFFRGNISFLDLLREAKRRKKVAAHQKNERRELENVQDAPARLTDQFASVSASELLRHFRERTVPFFQVNELEEIGKLQTQHFPNETAKLIADANKIVSASSWELAGLGHFEFTAENCWRCDPITGKDWGLDYHADVVTFSHDGADIRVLWELNRFGHAVTLACAYAVTRDEIYAGTFFTHIESWMKQNPYGRGANWNCAMEVALRAINLLVAFDIFRRSKSLTEERLSHILKLFDQHGRFILDNNEFSYITTSNHYLSDVIGLFWIGTMMPELKQSSEWRDLGLAEMFREIDKQILADGSDFEASTGYHKFVTEMFLYSCILAQRNDIELGPSDVYTEILRQMLYYLRRLIRPDDRMPLIGDADGSQIIPIIKRDADDAAYLLSVGAAFLDDKGIKVNKIDPEILWLFGETGLSDLNAMGGEEDMPSTCSKNGGAYIMRDGDLYLHFNANDCGINGRGSHGHNDALSIEMYAFGRPFIIDPGSYVYNLDRDARHLFRSTAYHSTVMVDDEEQNITDPKLPFVMGNEARPSVDEWRTSQEYDLVSGEHFGYTRLSEPITHRRTIEFFKKDRYWVIQDELAGKGRHKFSFSFHLAPEVNVLEVERNIVKIHDKEGRELFIHASGVDVAYEIIAAHASRNYGHKETSSILRWGMIAEAPFTARFVVSDKRDAEKTVN